MKPMITISIDLYDRLCEDSEAFNKIKEGKEFIHFTIWESIGGIRTTIRSNDNRVEAIKEASLRELEQIVRHKNYTIDKLQEELKEIKSRGFFKRLFS